MPQTTFHFLKEHKFLGGEEGKGDDEKASFGSVATETMIRMYE